MGKIESRKRLMKSAIRNQLGQETDFAGALTGALAHLDESEINKILDTAAKLTEKAREKKYRQG